MKRSLKQHVFGCHEVTLWAGYTLDLFQTSRKLILVLQKGQSEAENVKVKLLTALPF